MNLFKVEKGTDEINLCNLFFHKNDKNTLFVSCTISMRTVIIITDYEIEDILLREIQGNNNNQLLEEFVVVSVGVVISYNDKVAPALPGGHSIQDRISTKI